MTRERNNLKAGLFIIISIGLIVAIIIGIKGTGAIFLREVTHRVVFTLKDDVGGLAVGDPVRLGGVQVGSVRSIEFDEPAETQPRIVVRFSVPDRFVLHEDAVVAIQGTITGSTWLNIQSMGTGALATNTTSLRGKPSASSQLLANLSEVTPEIRGMLSDVRTKTIPGINAAIAGFQETGPAATSLMKKVESKVDPAYDKYATLADTGTHALANIRDMAGDSKADFRTTMANLSASTGSLKDKLPAILDKVDQVAAGLTKTIDGALVAMEDVKATLNSTKELAANARSILARNRGKIDDMIASLKTTGDNLKGASAEIRRSPWRLLYKPGPGEMANLNLYDAARQFAEGASDLNDSATSLRDLLSDSNASPDQVQKLVDRLDQSFNQFQQVEDKLWKSVKQ
jgi:phospholipid/cholesterol/gamma-HCH transport system substrate-binding protein